MTMLKKKMEFSPPYSSAAYFVPIFAACGKRVFLTLFIVVGYTPSIHQECKRKNCCPLLHHQKAFFYSQHADRLDGFISQHHINYADSINTCVDWSISGYSQQQQHHLVVLNTTKWRKYALKFYDLGIS